MNTATWTYQPQSARRMAPHIWLKGLCVRIAERAGVPVWMPRLAFLIFGLAHWLVAIIAYFILSKLVCGRATAAYATPPAPQSPVVERFAALDRRLAEMEAATLAQEANLRRAFRDLERNP